MHNRYRGASFLTSAAQLAEAPADRGWEVAFAGRSNSGKSSAINALCDQNSLSRTSKTPGRTQLLNFFQIDEERRLVDLPGYGYAKVSGAVQQRWQDCMHDYLTRRTCLRGVILLMDIRHPLTDYDRNMLAWGAARDLPIHVLLTKADKLNRGPALAQLGRVEQQMRAIPATIGIQIFSALKHQGIEQAHGVLDAWLGMPPL